MGSKEARFDPALLAAIERLADAAERLAPKAPPPLEADAASAFLWQPAESRLYPVPHVARVDLSLLRGVEAAKRTLLDNTQRFAAALPANNALLWGARGMGKSSLVKAVHGALNRQFPSLKLIEIHREDIATLPELLRPLRTCDARFVVLCDDLSFDADDTSYKALKAVLDGGIEGRPANVVFYATSNRRQLMPRDMIENERSTAITPGESVEEKVSLSDRFGLWIGFHKCSQDEYLQMVEGYILHHGLGSLAEHREDALEWAITRGSRSGRVAWQFITDLAGRRGQRLA